MPGGKGHAADRAFLSGVGATFTTRSGHGAAYCRNGGDVTAEPRTKRQQNASILLPQCFAETKLVRSVIA